MIAVRAHTLVSEEAPPQDAALIRFRKTLLEHSMDTGILRFLTPHVVIELRPDRKVSEFAESGARKSCIDGIPCHYTLLAEGIDE